MMHVECGTYSRRLLLSSYTVPASRKLGVKSAVCECLVVSCSFSWWCWTCVLYSEILAGNDTVLCICMCFCSSTFVHFGIWPMLWSAKVKYVFVCFRCYCWMICVLHIGRMLNLLTIYSISFWLVLIQQSGVLWHMMNLHCHLHCSNWTDWLKWQKWPKRLTEIKSQERLYVTQSANVVVTLAWRRQCAKTELSRALLRAVWWCQWTARDVISSWRLSTCDNCWFVPKIAASAFGAVRPQFLMNHYVTSLSQLKLLLVNGLPTKVSGV